MEEIRKEFEKGKDHGKDHAEKWMRQMKESDEAIDENEEAYKELADQLLGYLGLVDEHNEKIGEQNERIKTTIELGETHIVGMRDIRGEVTLWGQEIIKLTDVVEGLQDSFEELTATAIPKARDLSGVWYNVVS